jgi:hypothetical protein
MVYIAYIPIESEAKMPPNQALKSVQKKFQKIIDPWLAICEI